MRKLLGLVVVALVAILITAVPAQATFPGKNGKLAFSNLDHHNPDQGTWNRVLFSVAPDGTGLDTVASESGGNAHWSPDGTRLAFQTGLPVSCCHWDPDIEVINADGTGRGVVVDDDAYHHLSDWSPDGTKLLLTATPFGRHDEGVGLFTVNPDGSGYTRLDTDGGFGDGAAAWSPDGHRIVFAGSGGLFIMNADGSAKVRITRADSYPVWSPTGSQIAFTRLSVTDGNGTYDLYAVNPDGTGLVQLTQLGSPSWATISSPVWSHDGSVLFFSAAVTVNGASNIYRVNADGSGLRPLMTGSSPILSPDGRKLAFTVARPDDQYLQGDVYSANVDGTGLTRIVTLPGGNTVWDWQAIPGPTRSDYKNAAKFCKAEQDFWGDQFASRYSGGNPAYGKCVSGK